VLGIRESFGDQFVEGEEDRSGFAWAAVDHEAIEGRAGGASAWDLLAVEAAGSPDDPVPVIVDQNTAMWSLQMRGGIGEIKAFEYEPGKPIHFRVVALLSNSLLQGRLMIGESNFEKLFPDISGYRYFLIDTPPAKSDAVSLVLENRLGDIGMDVSRADDVLAGLLAVQNTYLRTFQSLGALGLLLGTIGLAVAQLRSVLERRQELAVLRAIGFTRKRLATLVMSETASLLLAGIGLGAICAIAAVLPYAWISGLKPPLLEPFLVVVGIILFGMLAGLIAVARVVRMPLTDALRPE
jgi:ABC-type antimicrobial peptide transport system permease subunit